MGILSAAARSFPIEIRSADVSGGTCRSMCGAWNKSNENEIKLPFGMKWAFYSDQIPVRVVASRKGRAVRPSSAPPAPTGNRLRIAPSTKYLKTTTTTTSAKEEEHKSKRRRRKGKKISNKYKRQRKKTPNGWKKKTGAWAREKYEICFAFTTQSGVL